MGCRPAKLSKVSVGITDSDYRNGKIINGRNLLSVSKSDSKDNITNESSLLKSINSNKSAKTDSKQVDSSSSDSIIPQMSVPKVAWANNRQPPSSTIPVIVQRSQSQIDFFKKLDEKINEGKNLEQMEDV